MTSKPYDFACQLVKADDGSSLLARELAENELIRTQIGEYAFINQVVVNVDNALPANTLIEYDLTLRHNDDVVALNQAIPDLLYPDQSRPSFVLKPALEKILHGSCRKPHFPSDDGLVQVDQLLLNQDFSVENRPSLLMMSGDQVYADDVSGPMLSAIHKVIAQLGLFTESWENDAVDGDILNHSLQLFEHTHCYYNRHLILPHDRVNKSWFDRFFAASKKPIFTSVNAKNHLVTLSEVLAMYILTWSPTMWALVDIDDDEFLLTKHRKKYQEELAVIKRFRDDLHKVRRALAHIPVYMIFDDHDITDDWNLTRGWEEAAYEHPFAKRIIGNALAGYYLCQGLGNGAGQLQNLSDEIQPCFTSEGVQNHDDLITELLNWEHWNFHLDTQPKMVILDTRTQRWRSESNAGKPSGLMDWESLSALQQELINQPAVVLVSPAPIYGVKLIEAVQRIFTFMGKPLAVDAENWMAHSGTANVMLNIFRHHKTPPNFVILSGDVHYSFVYDVTHRFRRNSSRIIQITCSGIKNTFPEGLLNTLERLNRYLYGVYSPLNWFTKRRRMKIRVRKPSTSQFKTLFNGSGIGQVKLSHNCEHVVAETITVTGEVVTYESKAEQESADA